ncbi:MAG: hypothetical protein KDC52_12205, partial [Ignavibacteriae bacterium]|nr:hypothetical protein [Ignavibacteriota bacterium]
ELEVRLGNINGNIITKINIDNTNDWKIIKSKIENIPTGVQNIVVINKGKKLEIDWISFE